MKQVDVSFPPCKMPVQALLWQMGYRHVAGVDEAGRGPLAGPVVAAACVIPRDAFIPGRRTEPGSVSMSGASDSGQFGSWCRHR